MRFHRPMLNIAATAALLLAACTPGQPAQSPGAASPGGDGGDGATLRVGQGGYPDSLNPGNGVLAEAYTLYENVFDTPISVTAEGEFVPELATEWSVSEDGLTWTMTLAEGVTFHDGEPLTAEDVGFTIELYRDTEAFPFLPSYAAPFETIEVTSDTELVLTTADPLVSFEAYMAFIYVLPKHIWEPAINAIPCPEATPAPTESAPPPCGAVAFQNDEMIGSGPFKMAEAVQDEFVRLDANTEYWGTPPSIGGVIFQKIENPDARITALTTGQVDAITEFPATAVATLQNTENVVVHIADASPGTLRDVFFNMVAEEDCPADVGECTGHPALKDVAVRQAMAMAVEKQQIIDVVTLGTASPGLSLVPPGLGEYYASDVQDYAVNVDEANSLLDEAGYADSDSDGVRECLPDQDCETLTFRFNYADDIDTAPREAELLQGMWEQIGVAIEIQGLDPDTLTSVCCPTFDFDIILWGWGSDPDPSFLLGVALCSEIDTGFSETGYCNPDYDALYDEQAVELDHAARVELIHEMQRILVEDVPYIIPYYSQVVEAWRTDTFTGWLDISPTFGLDDPSSLTVISPAQ